MGAAVPPLRVGIVLGAEILMHVLFWLPKHLKVMELSTIKHTSGSSARHSHSTGYLHTEEGH